jgi:hypothetical protein
MKKLIFGILVMFIAFVAMSQATDDYIKITQDVLKTEKKEAIAEVMDLTVDEAKVFWPLYDLYNEQLRIIQTKRIELTREFADNFSNMTDEKADEIFSSFLKLKLELVKLNAAYYRKFKKILFAGKAAKYLQAENKIATMVDYEIAKKVPYIETE